jgi:signal transduction histidine kinase
MTSRIATLEDIESFENRSNEPVKGNTANGSQLGVDAHPNHEINQSLNQKAQQRERLALLGTSAVVFAHEVGNPLHAIFGSLEFIETELQRRQIVDPALTSMIEGALRETDRLRALLRQFCSFAKGQNLDLQFVDVAKIIEEVLALQSLGHLAAGIAVKLECEKPLPLVMLDRAKITQAILNLCKNAVEAMPQGGTLTLRGYVSGENICVEIADTGVGTPEGVDIFELFTTTKSRGTGIGLAVARQLISAHGGTITYVSEPNQGTTFFLLLPLNSQPPDSVK